MSSRSPVRLSTANSFAFPADIHTLEPRMKEEPRNSMDLGGETDTSLYTDDDCSEASPRGATNSNGMGIGVWSKEEHAKFLDAIKIYANGPWKLVAAYVGTRTVRQTMTHAQKYRQKAARRLRGLRTKQALMRMHFGHRVSEESLIQERLRSIGAAHGNQLTCEPISYSLATPTVTPIQRPRDERHHVSTKTIEPSAVETAMTCTVNSVSPAVLNCSPLRAGDVEPMHPDVPMLTMDDMDLLEDLAASPSLEECASVLLDVLF
ncbi:hypothetical protein BBJ28_00019742 [Nothophytophthora sp. Chile5]|nr:hypothetical protein BBJ28_00019742 [Nothophytophthora sp. Chile5]